MSIDLILCSRPPLCCYATSRGMLAGLRSDGKVKVTDCCKLDFVDNDFHRPDFKRHLAVVKRVKPKYATAPDLFRPEQLPEVLEQAAMLAEYAENVIVIPKCNGVIHLIPKEYVIGISVPTKYGDSGSLHYTEAYGRNVHLLGGSPHTQYWFWRDFPGMDVVSIDGNTYMKSAAFGNFWDANRCGWNWSLRGKGYRREELIKMSIDNVVRFWREKGDSTPMSEEWAQAEEFRLKQKLPYDAKILHARAVAQEFYDRLDGNVFCSVGGLDSITLLLFLRRYIDPGIPGVTVSVLEDKSLQDIHKQLDNMVLLRPYKTKVQVIKDHGYPVVSKEKAGKIQMLQNPSEKNATVRHAIMTGDTGAQGGWRKGTSMKLPQKWLELFAGLENEKYGTHYQVAPFRVSPDCCYYMKEKPADDWAKANGRKPYMGLMASEGGQREKALIRNGCNYFGKTVTRSCPFAIFSRTDILQLAVDLGAPVPAIYGEIARQPNGTLETTRAKRTGCTMCGFGIHIEDRPHRFDRLREDSPKEWEFWMYRMGWGKVLDYIGVEWEKPYAQQLEMVLP